MEDLLSEFAIEKKSDIKWFLDELDKMELDCDMLLSLGKAYSAIGDLNKAVDILLIGLMKYQDDNIQYNFRSQLICCYTRLGITHEALYHIRINQSLNPDDIESKWFESFCYGLLGDNRSDLITIEMLNGELTNQQRKELVGGLDRYFVSIGNCHEAMKYMTMRYDNRNTLTPWLKVFDGKFEVGSNIVLYTGHGIGDELTMMRFLPSFKERGMNPIWYTNRENVADIVEKNGYKAVTELISCTGYAVNAFYLPYILGMDFDDIWSGSYLKPSLEAIEKFSGCHGYGVRCSGSLGFEYSLIRNVNVEDIYPYLPSGIAYSLNVDEVIDYGGIIPMNHMLKSIDDTMGLIYNLDFVITTCTSVAHMACAMGKKTIIFNSVPWFTWYKNNGKIFWYDDNLVDIIGRDIDDVWKFSEVEKRLQ